MIDEKGESMSAEDKTAIFNEIASFTEPAEKTAEDELRKETMFFCAEEPPAKDGDLLEAYAFVGRDWHMNIAERKWEFSDEWIFVHWKIGNESGAFSLHKGWPEYQRLLPYAGKRILLRLLPLEITG